MVQVMLRPWSLFIESLGSYSRCRVTNGVVPRVLGPTSFHLKIWVNILIIRMLLCSSSECWCSWCSASGFINDECLMSFWVCSRRDMRFVGLYPSKSNFSICIKSCWIKWDKVEPNPPNLPWSLCRREDSGSAASGPCFKGILVDSDQRQGYLWCKISFCYFSYLFTNYIVHSWKHVQKWTFWSSECSICCYFRLIYKT